MYKTILVPVDGSSRAEKILPYVEDLARGSESNVIFLYVIEPSASMVESYNSGTNIDYTRAGRLGMEAKSYLGRLTRAARKKGLTAKSVVEYGPVVRAILDVAEQENADLIAVASHGRTGLARVFYGSVAAGILQQVDRPLLIVRAGDN